MEFQYFSAILIIETTLIFIFQRLKTDLWKIGKPTTAVLVEAAIFLIAGIFLLLINNRASQWLGSRLDKLAPRKLFWVYSAISLLAAAGIILTMAFPLPLSEPVKQLLIAAALPLVINIEALGFIFARRIPRVRSFISWLLDTNRGNAAALSIIFLVGVFFSIINISTVYGPIHLEDEAEYWNFAHKIATGNLISLPEEGLRDPFYPLMLLPAFWFSASKSYLVAKLLNVVYLTSTIFPFFLLLKRLLGRRTALAGSVLLLLHPLYLMYPRVILSENVFIPLFFWVVLIAFYGFNSEKNERVILLEVVVLGVLAGFLYLTRFIGLAIFPAILVIWWIKPFAGERGKMMFSSRKGLYFSLLIGVIILVAGCWLLFGLSQGFSARTLMGFSIEDNPNPLQLTMRRLLMWAALYLNYMILMCAPIMGILGLGLIKFDFKKWRSDPYRWMIAVILIALGTLLASIRHSWMINYNYPIPAKLQSRYVVILGMLLLISALVVLKKYPLKKLGTAGILGYSIIPAGLIFISYQILKVGVLIVDNSIDFSINSADGDLISALGRTLFLYISTSIILAANLFIGRSKKLALLMVLSGLSIYYLSGMLPVYEQMAIAQADNPAVKVVTRQLLSDHANAQNPDTRLTVYYKTYHQTSQAINQIQASFNVYGFYNIKMVINNKLVTKKSDQILIVEANGEKLYSIYQFGRNNNKYNQETMKNTADGVNFYAVGRYSE